MSGFERVFGVEYVERKNIFGLVIDSDHCSSASSLLMYCGCVNYIARSNKSMQSLFVCPHVSIYLVRKNLQKRNGRRTAAIEGVWGIPCFYSVTHRPSNKFR